MQHDVETGLVRFTWIALGFLSINGSLFRGQAIRISHPLSQEFHPPFQLSQARFDSRMFIPD